MPCRASLSSQLKFTSSTNIPNVNITGSRAPCFPHPRSRTSEKQSESKFSPGVGELISVVSKADFTSSLILFKAFGIAPCLVAVGAVTVTWSVKSTLGVTDGCVNHIFQLSVVSPHKCRPKGLVKRCKCHYVPRYRKIYCQAFTDHRN
jgi:hypothetical protein